MNKITLVPLAIVALLALSGAAFAQESAAPSGAAPQNARGIIEDIRAKRADIKASIKDVRTGFKTDVRDLRGDVKVKTVAATSSKERRDVKKDFRDEKKELKEERQASTTALKAERNALARRHLGLITERYGIAIKQFENLALRIQSRIDKIKANGIDASKAETALGLALTAIAQVKTDLQALKDLILQADPDAEAKALRAEIEAAVKKANASVKAAHRALQTAAKSLVSLTRPQKTATSTDAQ